MNRPAACSEIDELPRGAPGLRSRASTAICFFEIEGRYFCGIVGAIFSGGAGGSATLAPSLCASAVGVAGSGAGVVGRVPPGFDSAGTVVAGAGGEGCTGWLA
jgi:hypothetical protein